MQRLSYRLRQKTSAFRYWNYRAFCCCFVSLSDWHNYLWNNEWVLNQWFADDYVSEVRLCRHFLSFQKSTNGLRIIMVRPLTSLIWKRNTAQIICRPRLPGSRHLTFTGQSNTSKIFPGSQSKIDYNGASCRFYQTWTFKRKRMYHTLHGIYAWEIFS